MSLNLLKQSLDILEQDSTSKNSTPAETPAKSSKQTQKNANKTRASLSGTRNKQTKRIGDIKQEIAQNTQKSRENLRKLLALSKNTLKNVDAEKIVKHAHKGRDVEMSRTKSKQEVESIFTDEDFRAFEEEYFKS